jgi:hypothetical protein
LFAGRQTAEIFYLRAVFQAIGEHEPMQEGFFQDD